MNSSTGKWAALKDDRMAATTDTTRATLKAGLSVGCSESHWADHWVVY